MATLGIFLILVVINSSTCYMRLLKYIPYRDLPFGGIIFGRKFEGILILCLRLYVSDQCLNYKFRIRKRT